MTAPTITVDELDRWTINWPTPKPDEFKITAEALEGLVADRNEANEMRRRASNARTTNDGQDVVVNDLLGGVIGSAGSMLWFILGREPLEFDPDVDDDLPIEPVPGEESTRE